MRRILSVLVLLVTVPVALHGGRVAAGGSGSSASAPWTVQRVLDVPGVAHLCSAHRGSHFIASVRGHLQSSALNGPAGGWVGRLFEQPNPRAYYAGDTRPFVEVWGTIRWPFTPYGRLVTFHGLLACDAATYGRNLPGWRGSIRPDRYSNG